NIWRIPRKRVNSHTTILNCYKSNTFGSPDFTVNCTKCLLEATKYLMPVSQNRTAFRGW
ncbi:hypothetical protein O3G_MSEX011765, partial [Manduca sexta]